MRPYRSSAMLRYRLKRRDLWLGSPMTKIGLCKKTGRPRAARDVGGPEYTPRVDIAHRLTRRKLILGGMAAIIAPAIIARPAQAPPQVIVRTPGGTYDDAITESIYDPFTRETGITVLKVPANLGKLLAMVESGNIELDVIDTDIGPQSTLARKGALLPIDYDGFRLTNPAQIDGGMRHQYFVGRVFFAQVIGYHSQAFPKRHPKSWSDFWDLNLFPGSRTLPGIGTGYVSLEFALLADGVPIDKLYPLDVNRAFKSLDHIRPSIRKFWETGAVSAHMLTEQEVVVGAFWNARIQAEEDAGAPVAIEWNQSMLDAMAYSIVKGAKNLANAKKLIDFSMQPKYAAAFASRFPYGPTSKEALKYMSADAIDKLPTAPKNRTNSFVLNAEWWEANREIVSNRWSQWLLHRS